MLEKEIEVKNALSTMIDYIKSNVKNDIAEQCRNIDNKELERLINVTELSIQHAYVNSVETILNTIRK